MAHSDRSAVDVDAPDSGFTLLEVMIAMLVMAIVTALILPALLVISKSSANTDSTTADWTVVRPALNLLERQISSAGTIWSPCSSATNAGTVPSCQSTTSSGFALLFWTPGSTATCTQWIIYNGTLEWRSWTPGATATTHFDPVASGLTVTNTSSSAQPPFVVGGTGGHLVQIDLWVKNTSTGTPLEVQTSQAAQGATTAPATTTCAAPASGNT